MEDCQSRRGAILAAKHLAEGERGEGGVVAEYVMEEGSRAGAIDRFMHVEEAEGRGARGSAGQEGQQRVQMLSARVDAPDLE